MKTILFIFVAAIAWLALQLPAAAADDPLDNWHLVDTTGNPPSSLIRYGQGKWLGADSQAHLVSSTNGTHWEIARTFGVEDHLIDLEYANGLWVLLLSRQSTNLLVESSLDGITWSEAAVPVLPPPDFRPYINGGLRLLNSGGEWVVRVRKRLVLRSTDGRNWTMSELGVPPGEEIFDLAYGDGKWVAQVMSGAPYPYLSSSTNLINWEWWRSWPPDDSNNVFYSLKHFNGVWFGTRSSYVHESGPEYSILTSTDGTQWTRRIHPSLHEVTLIDNRLVVSGANYVYEGGYWTNRLFESDALVSLRVNRPGEVSVRRAAGFPVVVEASDDLQTWHTLTNLAAGLPIETVTDTVTNASKRFYRAHTP